MPRAHSLPLWIDEAFIFEHQIQAEDAGTETSARVNEWTQRKLGLYRVGEMESAPCLCATTSHSSSFSV